MLAAWTVYSECFNHIHTITLARSPIPEQRRSANLVSWSTSIALRRGQKVATTSCEVVRVDQIQLSTKDIDSLVYMCVEYFQVVAFKLVC